MLKPDNKGATKKYGKTKGKSEFINYVKYLRVVLFKKKFWCEYFRNENGILK